MIKKYLIRIVGALCILGAAALMFMPAWLQIKDIPRRDVRDLREDVSGICTAVSDRFIMNANRDDDFKEELKDYGLPYTRGKINSRFATIEDLAKSILDCDISLQELLVLGVEAPGLIKDATNMIDSRDVSAVFYGSTVQYVLFEGTQAITEDYDDDIEKQIIEENIENLENATEDVVEVLSDISFLFAVLAGVLILVLALAVASAVTHVCNKTRWLKYIFLTVLVLLVVGSCLAVPMASEMIAGSMDAASAYADVSLRMTATPFISVALMIVPIILDIVYERKKKANLMEA